MLIPNPRSIDKVSPWVSSSMSKARKRPFQSRPWRGADGDGAPYRPLGSVTAGSSGYSKYANAKRRVLGVNNLMNFSATRQLPLVLFP